jgi:hypothetical protein
LTNETRPLRLTLRDYDLIEDVARFRFLSSYHLERRHFPKDSKYRHSVALNRLAILVKHGYLTKGDAYPRWVPGRSEHKIAVYTWLPTNQKVLREHLADAGRSHLWGQRYARHAERLPATGTFSPYTMFHELLLTDFLLWVDGAVMKDGWTVAFWERYGPREADITGEFRTRDGKRKFNPDALVCLRNPEGRHAFRTVEADKHSTSQEGKYREKLEGHQLAQATGHYAEVIRHKIEAYDLPIPQPAEVQNVVLTVTHTRERRNALLIESAPLGERYRFLFACIDELHSGDGLAPVWLRGHEYFNLMPRKDYPANALDSVRKRWLAEQFEAMPKVPPVPRG